MVLRAVMIEDNPADARLVREMLLDTAGDEVELEWLDTLDEGVKRVVRGDVDVVLLDLSLPDSDGLESVSTVHLFDSVVPIVVLTGREDADTSLQAVREGAQDYLVKGSFDGERLLRAVRFAIERTHAGTPAPKAGAPEAPVRAVRVPTGGRLVPKVARYLQRAQEQQKRVVYVCLDRPAAVLAEALRAQGIDLTHVRFVDLTAEAPGSPDADVTVADVQDLDSLWNALRRALEDQGSNAWLVFDSVNALLLQHSVDLGAELVHFVANRLRLLRLGGDFFCHRNHEWSLISDRFTSFLDDEVDLEDLVDQEDLVHDPSVS